MNFRIYIDDTDCGGIVYHTNYIKYCERARSEIFFARGMLPGDENTGFVVSSLNANFIKPAKLGDELEVKTTLLELKSASLRLKQEIFKGDELIFSMDIKLAFLDLKAQKIAKIPEKFLEVLQNLKG